MKFVYTTFVAVLFAANMFAQAPQKLSYQAVIRNSSNALVASTPVGMRISILKGSAAGTAVFVETQTQNTNSNGLVSLEIGTGGLVTGSIAGINWAAGPYFIKTETDPLGGTAYSISGTSEFLTVPYSFHALNGLPNGNAPGDMLYWNGTAWVEIGSGQEGQMLTFHNGRPTWTPTSATSNITIGSLYGGGVVAYILQPGDPGYSAAVQHGLIVAPGDQSASAEWGCYAASVNLGTALTLGSGASNTALIVNGCNQTGIAAKLCDNLNTGGYSDWYLPSKAELNLIYGNISSLSAANFLTTVYYWTSSENGGANAYAQLMSSGASGFYFKNLTPVAVRAVRSF